MKDKKTLIYSAYGLDELYHLGVIFNFLKSKSKGIIPDDCSVVVYTDKCDLFKDVPIQVIDISEYMDEWTLDSAYHFRIKNLVLQDAINRFGGTLIHLDSDIFIEKNINNIFELIKDDNAVLYKMEGRAIRSNAEYLNLIENKENLFRNFYDDLNQVCMYGSAVIGINESMYEIIKEADRFIIKWSQEVGAHTVEQFALSESLLRAKIHITTVFSMTSSYSSSGSKIHARQRINEYFLATKNSDYIEKINLINNWNVRRTFFVWLKQKLNIKV